MRLLPSAAEKSVSCMPTKVNIRNNLTIPEALNLALSTWQYLARHGEISKFQDLPYFLWRKIKPFRNHNPLCEAFFYCKDCPLYNAADYIYWKFTGDYSTREILARRTVLIIRARMAEEES